MILVTSMGKVHPGNVHAGVNHLNEKIDFFGGWTNCTYDSGQPYPGSFGQNVQAGQIVHGGRNFVGITLFGGNFALWQNRLKKKKIMSNVSVDSVLKKVRDT